MISKNTFNIFNFVKFQKRNCSFVLLNTTSWNNDFCWHQGLSECQYCFAHSPRVFSLNEVLKTMVLFAIKVWSGDSNQSVLGKRGYVLIRTVLKRFYYFYEKGNVPTFWRSRWSSNKLRGPIWRAEFDLDASNFTI